MQPLDIGVCLKQSTVALESIGHLCQAVIGNTHTGIATFRIRPPGSGILAHFLAGTDNDEPFFLPSWPELLKCLAVESVGPSVVRPEP